MCFTVGKNQVTLHFFAEHSFQVEASTCACCIDTVFLLKFWIFKLSQLCVEHRLLIFRKRCLRLGTCSRISYVSVISCSSDYEIELWRNTSVGWDDVFYSVLLLLSSHQVHNFIRSSFISRLVVASDSRLRDTFFFLIF